MEIISRGLEVLGLNRSENSKSSVQGRQRIVYNYELGPSKADKVLFIAVVGTVGLTIASTMFIDLGGGLEAFWNFISSTDLSSPSSSGLPGSNNLLPSHPLSSSLLK